MFRSIRILALAATLTGAVSVPGRADLASGTLDTQPVLSRSTTFIKAPPALAPFPALRADTIGIEAQGPTGLDVTMKPLPDVTLPGGKKLRDVLVLVSPAVSSFNVTALTTTTKTTSTSTTAEPVGTATTSGTLTSDFQVQQDPTLTTLVTVKKLLIFKGLAASSVPDTFLRAYDVEIVAATGVTDPASKKTRVLLTYDDGVPKLVSVLATDATAKCSDCDFPYSDLPSDPRYNKVSAHSDVRFTITDFTPKAGVSNADAPFYRVIAQYDDGAKFACSFENKGPNGIAGQRGIEVRVPNIGRGGFRVLARSPYGTATSAHYDFPSNLFIGKSAAFVGLSAVNVDTPLTVSGEYGWWAPTRFQPPQLPDSRNRTYGEWESVTLGAVHVDGVAVASAKITHTPAKGSLAYDGNMPRFTGSAAGIGFLKADWTAKIRIYEPECTACRVTD